MGSSASIDKTLVMCDKYGGLLENRLGRSSFLRRRELVNGWLISALLGVICLAVFSANKKAMWSWIVLIMGVIMLFDTLSKALRDPLVWLLAVVAVAIIIYRGYRKYRRSWLTTNPLATSLLAPPKEPHLRWREWGGFIRQTFKLTLRQYYVKLWLWIAMS